jgi:hypothetical protein
MNNMRNILKNFKAKKEEELVGICPICDTLFTTNFTFQDLEICIIDRENAEIIYDKMRMGKKIVVQCPKCHHLVNLIPGERMDKKLRKRWFGDEQ